MSDSKETVVMGVSDALALMPRFDGNESNVIWPEWRLDLKRRVTFEFGKVGVDIINGDIDEGWINDVDDIGIIQPLLEALTPKTRAFVQFRSEWIETYKKQVQTIGEDGKMTTETRKSTRLSYVGKMNVRKAIERIKTSYFMSIEKHGIVHGSKVHKDFLKLRDKYTTDTLPQWFEKMEIQYGVAHEELLNAYVEQLTVMVE